MSLNQVLRDYNSRQQVKVLHTDVILQDLKQINVNHKTTTCILLVLPEIITSVVNKMHITRDKEWFPLEYVFIVGNSNLVDVLVGQRLINLKI